MSVRSIPGAMRRKVLCSLYRRPALLRNRKPIVSFTFDDFPRTAYLVGGSILERYGARGTYYAACGLMNGCNELGEQFRSEDVDSLLEKGHELASHTFDHVSCRSVSCAEFCEDVKRGSEAVEELSGIRSGNFAYPFGHVTVQAKCDLATKVSSARSIFPGCNGPEVDLNLLRANSLYGDLDGARRVEELIEENVRLNTWLIFYTHDVQAKPSAFGCTPALFEAAVSHAARRGCRILSVQEGLEEAGVQNGNPKGHVREYAPA
ncbi:MAG: polysaccharide deacetylase family protein [Candidatus Sulfotelmatobacter sp.]